MMQLICIVIPQEGKLQKSAFYPEVDQRGVALPYLLQMVAQSNTRKRWYRYDISYYMLYPTTPEIDQATETEPFTREKSHISY